MKTTKSKPKQASEKQTPDHGRTSTARPEAAASKVKMPAEELAAALSRYEDWKMIRRKKGLGA